MENEKQFSLSKDNLKKYVKLSSKSFIINKKIFETFKINNSKVLKLNRFNENSINKIQLENTSYDNENKSRREIDSEITIINSPKNIEDDIDIINLFNKLSNNKLKTTHENNLNFYSEIKLGKLNLTDAEKFYKLVLKYLSIKHKKIILIADDNEIIRNSIKKLTKNLFKDKGFSTITLSDRIEILYMVMLDQSLKNCIKIIISDEQMIFLNGSDANNVLKLMQKDKKISFIPFVFCSSNKESGHFNMNGNNYCLNKPPTKRDIQKLFEDLKIV